MFWLHCFKPDTDENNTFVVNSATITRSNGNYHGFLRATYSWQITFLENTVSSYNEKVYGVGGKFGVINLQDYYVSNAINNL